MFFFQQFETFDPVSSDVPPYPFSYMPAIGLRARALMNFRMSFGSSEEKKERIIAIARRINQEIEQYFDDIKYLEIERLREQAGLLESMGGDPEWPPNEDDLDIQTWVNVNEVEALKSILEKRDLFMFFQAINLHFKLYYFAPYCLVKLLFSKVLVFRHHTLQVSLVLHENLKKILLAFRQ